MATVDGKKTGGRQKGVPNKATKALKEMILASLDDVGGQAYLARQANENPSAFLTLIGKVLPMQVSADVRGDITVVTGVPRAD